MNKGQAGIEFLTVIAIGLMLLIPVSLMFQSYASQTTSDVLDQQIVLMGSNMLSKAEEMYSLGPNSFTTLDIRMPEKILNVTIAGRQELAFTYDGPHGPSDVVFFSERVELTNSSSNSCEGVCSLGLVPGPNNLRIRSIENRVALSVVEE